MDNPYVVSELAAGVLHLDNGIELLKRLLDSLSDDFHDGVFMAVYHSQNKFVHELMLSAFERWIDEEGDRYGSGTGEIAWLGSFLDKWVSNGMFSISEVEGLLKWRGMKYYKYDIS